MPDSRIPVVFAEFLDLFLTLFLPLRPPRAVLDEEANPRGVMPRSSHIRLCWACRKLRDRRGLVFEYMFE